MTKLCILMLLFSIAAIAKDKNGLSRKDRVQIIELEQISWNYQEVEMYQENEKLLKRLEKRLTNGQVIGIELVIAAPTSIRFESKWGHSMMRFVDNVRTSNNDIALGFIADLDTPKTSYIKGAIGSYPVFPMLKTLGGFTEQYIKGEDRALNRYIIPTTPAMIQKMITRLRAIWDELKNKNEASLIKQANKLKIKLLTKLKMKKNKGKSLRVISESGFIIGYTIETEGKEDGEVYAVKLKTKKSKDLKGYTFLKNNCAGALVNFFKKTAFEFVGGLKWSGRIPVKMDKYFDKNYLSSFPKVSVPALTEFKAKLENLTTKTYSELNDFDAWAAVDMNQLMNSLSTKEKMLLMDQENLGIPPKKQDQALEHLQLITDKPNYDELYQISTLPSIMYRACADKTCVQDQLVEAANYFEAAEIIKKVNTMKKIKKKKLDKPFIGELIKYNNLLRLELER
jgi:hypothetical protein